MRKTAEKQDEDRRRIARQLHDSVAQKAAALQINLSLIAESQAGLRPRAVQALNDSLELAQALAKDVREIESALHPPLLDQLGLTAALEARAQSFSEQTGGEIKLDLPARTVKLPRHVQTGLFRIVEEALSNARGKKSTSLALVRKPKSLELELEVSGAIRAPAIAIMRERAKLLGGRLTIKGGRVRFVLPLKQAKKDRTGR